MRLLVRHPTFKRLIEQMQECQSRSIGADEPLCMSLEGPTGAGKSTLVRHYQSLYPRYATVSGTITPVFAVHTPSPVTIRALARQMLEGLADPLAHLGSASEMTARLLTYLRGCGVQLIIFDDFHHLIEPETDHVLANVSNWLKVLLKQAHVPALVVAVPGHINKILDYSISSRWAVGASPSSMASPKAMTQLGRLFRKRATLEQLAFSLDAAETCPFGLFVQCVEEETGIMLPEGYSKADTLARLERVTGGLVANIMYVFRQAAYDLERLGRPQLDMPLLAEAVQEGLGDSFLAEENVFVPSLRNRLDRPLGS